MYAITHNSKFKKNTKNIFFMKTHISRHTSCNDNLYTSDNIGCSPNGVHKFRLFPTRRIQKYSRNFLQHKQKKKAAYVITYAFQNMRMCKMNLQPGNASSRAHPQRTNYECNCLCIFSIGGVFISYMLANYLIFMFILYYVFEFITIRAYVHECQYTLNSRE